MNEGQLLYDFLSLCLCVGLSVSGCLCVSVCVLAGMDVPVTSEFLKD